MRVGVIGLGNIGFAIAKHLHKRGHEIFSWTRTEKFVPWENSLDLKKIAKNDLDFLFIASGAARPNFGNEVHELASTSALIPHLNFPRNIKIFYISSGAVYGECLIPQTEAESANPTTLYGKSKLVAEMSLNSLFKNQVTCLRVGNVIDINNPYGIFTHLNSAIKRRTLEILGDPSDCRDYIGVSDLLLALDRLLSLKDLPDVINIGSGRSLMLSELVALFKSEIQGDFSINWSPRRPGDLSKSKLHTGKMKEMLGIEPMDPTSVILDFVRESS